MMQILITERMLDLGVAAVIVPQRPDLQTQLGARGNVKCASFLCPHKQHEWILLALILECEPSTLEWQSRAAGNGVGFRMIAVNRSRALCYLA